MTPREALDVLLGLVEAGKKATPGEWRGSMTGHSIKAARDCREVIFAVPCSGKLDAPGWREWLDNVDFVVIAANARPALETLAGCVVVSRESFDAFRATLKFIEGYWGECDEENSKYLKIVKPIEDRFRAAIAEAEEAMR
jgi:hypothetical protein